jgi:hypothetical protein
VETPSARLVSGFEFLGTQPAEMTLIRSFFKLLKNDSATALSGAVAFSAHAGLQAIGAAEPPPGIAPVLRALIRVNHRTARSPSAHRLQGMSASRRKVAVGRSAPL